MSLASQLRHCALFSSLSEEQSLRLVSFSRKQRHARNAVVVQQGTRHHVLYLLLAGRAHMFRTAPDGREVITEVLKAGDHFGELSLIDGLPHSTSVRCEESCDVLEIQGAAVAGCLVHHPKVAMALTQLLTARLRRAHHRVGTLAHKDVSERLLEQLKALATEHDGALHLHLPIVRRDLAKMIGASREMVSRTMASLEAKGVLLPLPEGGWRISEDERRAE